MADNIYTVDPYAMTVGTVFQWDDMTGTDWFIISGVPYTAPSPYLAIWIRLDQPAGAGQGSPYYGQVEFMNFTGGLVTPVISVLSVFGQIENAIGGQGSDHIEGGVVANYLQGDATDVAGGNDQMWGWAGNDTIAGVGGNDEIRGGSGDDLLYGDWDPFSQDGGNFAAGNDTVFGEGGNDTLYGGIGTNALHGGADVDTLDYSGFFDDFGNVSYRIEAYVDSGTVAVYAKDLFDQTETLVAQDTISEVEVIIGTSGDDKIIGNGTFTPDDVPGTDIYGGLGKDTLTGYSGADRLYGGDGEDTMTDYGTTLAAPGARSVMTGGAGNDFYNVFATAIDIVETATGGYDYVMASVSFTLPAFVEHLYLSDAATTRLDGTGNGLNNQLEGTHLANLLSGLAGNDYLEGFGGNDTLYGGVARDTLAGGDGSDRLYGGTKSDVLLGEAGADFLYGGTEADSLSGGTQNDFLQGGAGADTLRGGSGADVFFFAAGDAGVGALTDRIADFLTGVDHIDLHKIKTGQTFIGATAFGHHAGEVQYTQSTGVLSGDTTGDATADWQILLGAGRALVAADLIL